MSLRNRLRLWWQVRTGEEETPIDGDVPAWLISLVVHLGLLLILTLILRELPPEDNHVELVTSVIEEDLEVPEEFFFSELEKVEIGANSVNGVDMADAVAELQEQITELSTPEDVAEVIDLSVGELVIDNPLDTSMALESVPNLIVQGAAGAGTTGAAGAIDRITQEIIDSLDERKTLVVWIFDQSVSLSAQREAIFNRLDRIYEELNVIEASGDPRFSKHHDKPLLSSVVAFGENITFRTPKPTDLLPEVKAAVASIEDDDSGIERVFAAVHAAADRYKSYAAARDRRNVMLIVFTDEAGDDATPMLDRTVDLCRRFLMPVYVVGVPAPFGRDKVEVKWVDPDPEFDQSPQWTHVRQGPESLYPERVRLAFSSQSRNEEPMDSGFGPFALTRLAVETSGIYFSVHPNRNPGRPVGKAETAHLSGYLKYFFDPKVMRRYRPDYVNLKEYARRVQQNQAKLSLISAAKISWTAPMGDPKLVFQKRSEADLANSLTKAQQKSAKLMAGPLLAMYSELKKGERHREKVIEPRWKAGYDLAMGRTLAVKVRTQGYNNMLAQAKRGMKFKDEGSDTWVLKPTDEILSGSALEKEATQARTYLQRVIDEHPGTPWALVAAQELSDPLGWEWSEKTTNVARPQAGQGNNNNPRPRPRDDQKRMIKRKVKRPPPKL